MHGRRLLGVWAAVAGLVLSLFVAAPAQAAPLPPNVVGVAPTGSTTPSTLSGDSIDDPAIWANTANPAQPLIIANNKKGALEVYNLDGSSRQRITTPTGFWGNVDVRGNYVVVAKSGIRVYEVTNPTGPAPLQLALESTGNATTGGEGLCLYDPGAPGLAGGLYAINVQRNSFRVRMHPLTDTDNDGALKVERHIKQFYLGSEGEGCVVDDSTGYLYVSEEEVGIWRYDLKAPGSGAPPKVQVDEVGPQLVPDVEGLTLVNGWLIASSQNIDNPEASFFNAYNVNAAGFPLATPFRVTDGALSDPIGLNDCDQSDGIAATSANLGPEFPNGIFVCQDGFNHTRNSRGRVVKSNQNLKIVNMEDVVKAIS